MMTEWLSRTELLIGKEALKKLQEASHIWLAVTVTMPNMWTVPVRLNQIRRK